MLDSESQINELIKLIEDTHAPIAALREVTKQQLVDLESRVLPHYGIADGVDPLIKDPTNGAETYNPIFYDAEELTFEWAGVFRSNDPTVKNVFAFWASFTHKAKGIGFTVIDTNLYGTESLIVSHELSSILREVESTPDIKDDLVFLAGTATAVSPGKTTLKK